MDKIIYTRGTYSTEAQKIEMDVTENLDIHAFKIICKRLACALGYSGSSVDNAFDNTSHTDRSSNVDKKIIKG
tara:strand:+ start:719 stop:937 length:219 start_codon:yes stop_codon:yes gene_type:complete